MVKSNFSALPFRAVRSPNSPESPASDSVRLYLNDSEPSRVRARLTANFGGSSLPPKYNSLKCAKFRAIHSLSICIISLHNFRRLSIEKPSASNINATSFQRLRGIFSTFARHLFNAGAASFQRLRDILHMQVMAPSDVKLLIFRCKVNNFTEQS